MPKIFTFLLSLFLFGRGISGGSDLPFAIEDLDGKSLSDLNISPKCRRDFLEYINGFKGKKKWAIQMFDSMGKFPRGFLQGSRTELGQMDECLDVIHTNFTGQHCIVELNLAGYSANVTVSSLPTSLERLAYSEFAFGVCIPSTCNTTDLRTALNATGLDKILPVFIHEHSCISERSPLFRTKDYVVLGLFSFVILLSLVSTAYDVYHTLLKKTEIPNTILISFSLHNNLKLLLRKSDNSENVPVLHGIRTLSISWVIFGHFYLFDIAFGNDVNTVQKLAILDEYLYVPVTNAYLSVDSFLFMSGFLVCFVFFRNISGKGTFDVPVALINRYIRLTPPFVAVILFNYTILSHLTVAPYSKVFFLEEELACGNYFWAYLLYVPNYVFQESKLCLPTAWYLGVDTQMFLLSPFILYVLLFWPRFGFKYLLALISGSTMITFWVCYKYDLEPNYSMEQFNHTPHEEYVWTHTRMTPWLVGVAAGYIQCGIKAKKILFRPKKIWVAIGWSIAILLCFYSLFGIVLFYPYRTARSHPRVFKAAYRAGHRLCWSLGLSWIVIACVNDYGGIINTILSQNIFQTLGKLSFSAYLVHYPLQITRLMNENKSLKNFNNFRTIYTIVGDVTLTILIAVPFTLLFEMPFSHIQNAYIKKLEIFPYPKQGKRKENCKCSNSRIWQQKVV